jgi:hypothetical protein
MTHSELLQDLSSRLDEVNALRMNVPSLTRHELESTEAGRKSLELEARLEALMFGNEVTEQELDNFRFDNKFL